MPTINRLIPAGGQSISIPGYGASITNNEAFAITVEGATLAAGANVAISGGDSNILVQTSVAANVTVYYQSAPAPVLETAVRTAADAVYLQRSMARSRPVAATDRNLGNTKKSGTATDLGGNATFRVRAKGGTYVGLVVVYEQAWTNSSQALNFQQYSVGLTNILTTASVKNITESWSGRRQLKGNTVATIKTAASPSTAIPVPGLTLMPGESGSMTLPISFKGEDLLEFSNCWQNPTIGDACVFACVSNGAIAKTETTPTPGYIDSYENQPTATTVLDQTMVATPFTVGGFQQVTASSVDHSDVWRPVAIYGIPADASQEAVLFDGDSVAVGNTFSSLGGAQRTDLTWGITYPSATPGIFASFCQWAGVPYVTVGASGNTLGWETGEAESARGLLLDGGNHVFMAFGTNDMTHYGNGNVWNASTNDYPALFATFKANLAARVAEHRGRGARKFSIVGPMPRGVTPTLTGAQVLQLITPASQTLYENGSNDPNGTYLPTLIAWHEWLERGADGMLGSYFYVNLWDFACSAPDSGKWNNGGLLPNALGSTTWTVESGSTTLPVVSAAQNTAVGATGKYVDCVLEFLTLGGVAPSAADQARVVDNYSYGNRRFTVSTLSVAAQAGDTFRLWKPWTKDLSHPNVWLADAAITSGAWNSWRDYVRTPV
jgi:hypothetical protein